MLPKQYQDNIATIVQKIQEAEVIVVGGASSMSTANGHDFYRHSKYWIDSFSEFERNYGIKGEEPTPEMLKNKAITMNADIAQVLRDLVSHMQGRNSLDDGIITR